MLTRKVIKVGMVGDTYTQVLSGLTPGQSVVLADYAEAVPSSNTDTHLGRPGRRRRASAAAAAASAAAAPAARRFRAGVGGAAGGLGRRRRRRLSAGRDAATAPGA